MIDVDHFKKVNDTYGHSEGDRVLKAVAKTMQSIVRQSDFLCRYGGEEFAVICPGSDLDQAIYLAHRLCSSIPNNVAVDDPKGEGRKVTVTIGLASFIQEVNSKEALIKLADARLYQGKQSGRNQVVPNDIGDINLTAVAIDPT
jgi:diguanylate cyclase (GGDEF)-like protein